jgi:hypothetical protein
MAQAQAEALLAGREGAPPPTSIASSNLADVLDFNTFAELALRVMSVRDSERSR